MNKKIILFIILVSPLFSFGQIFNPSDASICKGGNTSFKSGSLYPTATYKWLLRHSGVWNYLSNVAPFSGATTTTLTLTSVSDTLNGDSFKCEVTFGSSVVGISKAAKLTVSGSSSNPTSASASVNPVNCPGGSTQLSVTGYLSGGSSWKWYTGKCGKTAVSSLATPDSTTTYYVRAEGTCGDTTSCVSVTVVVTNKKSIAPGSVSASPSAICSGQSSTLAVVGGSLGSGAIWKWYSGATCSVLLDSQGVSSLSVSPTSTSSYSVKADGTCGSTACKFVTVTVNQRPIINAGNDTAICLNSVILLNASAIGTNTYLWNPTTGLDAPMALNPNASPASTTTYILTATNTFNCSVSDTVQIQVNKLPKAVVSKDTTICLGGTANLKASGGKYYSWVPTSSLDFPNTADPHANPKITIRYKVTVTDQNQCTDTAAVKVSVNPVPKINASNDTSICKGKSALLHAEDGITYIWSPAKGLDFPNSSNPKATPDSSVAYKIKVTNSYGCSLTDSVLITVKPLPIVNAGQDAVICNGVYITLSTNSGTGYNFSWKPSTFLSTSNIHNPTANPDTTTTYEVLVNLNGCTNRDSVKVTVLNGPSPHFTLVDSVVCNNSIWSQYSLPLSSHLFKWSVGNGSIMAGQGTNSIYVHWSNTASSGNVNVTDSLKTNPSCPVKLSFNVTISGGPAPSPTSVFAKGKNLSSGILVCPVKTFKFYEWGYENKITRSEQKSCSGDTLCAYVGGIDTSKNYYWVKVGQDKACLTKSFFNQPIALSQSENYKSLPILVLYPNPVTDKLTIQSSSPIQSITISNQFGQSISVPQSQGTNNQFTLDMSPLTPGIYFISFNTNSGDLYRKILKN